MKVVAPNETGLRGWLGRVREPVAEKSRFFAVCLPRARVQPIVVITIFY